MPEAIRQHWEAAGTDWCSIRANFQSEWWVTSRRKPLVAFFHALLRRSKRLTCSCSTTSPTRTAQALRSDSFVNPGKSARTSAEAPAKHPHTTSPDGGEVIVIKKYPNRRLYDTRASTYITLTEVKAMVLEGKEFVVRDVKTDEDITRSILLQIILDEEAGTGPMFTTQMLASIIRFYGHAMQGLMGTYLEKNIQTFIEIQKQLTTAHTSSSMNPDIWSSFLNVQTPMLQGMVANYLEQSKRMFVQMQENLKTQTETILGTGKN